MAKYVVTHDSNSLFDWIKSRKEIFISTFAVLLAICVITGTSYAAFTSLVTGSNNESMTVGTFNVEFTEGQTVKLVNTSPLTDSEGLALAPYVFNIKNSGTLKAKYRVKLVEDTTLSTLDISKIKISYSINSISSTPRLLSADNGLVIDEGILEASTNITYDLRFWVDNISGNEVQGKSFKAKVVVEAVQFVADVTDKIPPTVTLNGDLMEVKQKSDMAYVDQGVLVASDNADASLTKVSVKKSYEYYNPLTNTTIPVNEVNLSKIGIYYIYYLVMDSNNNVGLAVRTVNVTNSLTPPSITLLGSNVVNIALGSNYVEPGFTAIDKDNTVLTANVVQSGDIKVDVAGSYTLKYLVTDKDNILGSVTRIVVVS